MPVSDFEPLLAQAHALSLEYLGAQASRHVGAQANLQELQQALGGALAEEGEDPASVLARLAALLRFRHRRQPAGGAGE